jgi:periplasmic protein TonB
MFTLVLWATSLAVGVGGLVMGYPHSPAPAPPLSPVQATLIHVRITQDTMPPPEAGAAEESAQAAPAPQAAPPPPTPEAMTPPEETPLAQVAIAAPVMVVPEKVPPQAVPQRTAAGPPAVRAPQVTHLVFGQGEGRQPAPEYPREAALAGEEGTVGLRFTVDVDGSVLTVEVSSPSPWPLLNQAAARAVRDQWRFVSGGPRTFQVFMRFQLKHD